MTLEEALEEMTRLEDTPWDAEYSVKVRAILGRYRKAIEAEVVEAERARIKKGVEYVFFRCRIDELIPTREKVDHVIDKEQS